MIHTGLGIPLVALVDDRLHDPPDDTRTLFVADEAAIPHLPATATAPSIRLAGWGHATRHGEPLQAHVLVIQAQVSRFLGQRPCWQRIMKLAVLTRRKCAILGL